ncbi:hypothetical protein [Arvimicrobium flavum]|uniref:hypothetical protein n=1 Tax=Arvimicrobium flavum TaxID=3393320 RepID=UPI00237A7020|nr:hypothetical protein [Mesorhizobium shangrilense]
MFCRSLFLAALLLASGCVSFVAPYDPTFDQSLNKLSEDTATFLAAASAGGPERRYGSQETVAYYAATYNVLDRLILRAKPLRGSKPCASSAGLKTFTELPYITTVLPEDYERLDCRESQLYSTRFYVDALNYAQKNDGVLNGSEIKYRGGTLQTAIMGTIQTLLENKPEA